MSSTNNAASVDTNTRNVRQRANPIGLENLPDDTLLRVATYLSHTTRALLSVALTAPSTSYDLGGHNESEKDIMAKKVAEAVRECGWQSAASDSLSNMLSSAIASGQLKKINNNPQHQKLSKASKIVLSNPYHKIDTSWYNTMHHKYKEDWKVLDLLDLDKSLRMRLTDGDIAGILVCIDAVNNLEEIRLPHCINVRGDGLAPLRGSVVLKKADLSTLSEEFDTLIPKLSIDSILPIFDSIMANQNSMSRLHVPKVWFDTHSEKLNIFYIDNYSLKNIQGYEQMSEPEKSQQRAGLLNQSIPWSEHDEHKIDCVECNFWHFSNHKGVRITFEGGQRIEACPNPKCGRKYCCDNDNEYEHAKKIKKCDVCKETKCEECSGMYECNGGCGRTLCTDCTIQLHCHAGCDAWETENCLDCAINGSGCTRKCGGCHEDLCKFCDPGLTHMGTGERACEVCRGVDEADWHGPNNPAEID